MSLNNASFLGRLLRRTGRFGIALISLLAFFIAGGAAYLITSTLLGVWFPKLCLIAAFAAAIGVYRIFDRLDLIPDDPDAIITLSLTERKEDIERRGWVSGDNPGK